MATVLQVFSFITESNMPRPIASAVLTDGQQIPYDTALQRFDPVFWLTNFGPIPMVASITIPRENSVRVDAISYGESDLTGFIWNSEDTKDHPMLRYETNKDYRNVTLEFTWIPFGPVAPLNDEQISPTLAMEGRDESGNPKVYFIRLYNYATDLLDGSWRVSIDFDTAIAGWDETEEPLYAGDVDNIFISIPSTSYVEGSTSQLSEPIVFGVELSDIQVTGTGAYIKRRNVEISKHEIGVCIGASDATDICPERLLYNASALGYDTTWVNYVGMAHWPVLKRSGEAWIADDASPLGVINPPAESWGRALARMAKTAGLEIIWSLSYELLWQNSPPEWAQRDLNGEPALTGWSPPSTLISPANTQAVEYLKRVGARFVSYSEEAGITKRFQAGEQWWWTGSITNTGSSPYIYDDATVAAIAPEPIENINDPLTPAQRDTLDAAGALNAVASVSIANASGADFTYLLIYTAGILNDDFPEIRRMNCPPGWKYPAFDYVQVEDYDWAQEAMWEPISNAIDYVTTELEYPIEAQEYFAGFVWHPEDAERLWTNIVEAGNRFGIRRRVHQTYYWALHQVMRDGLVILASRPRVKKTYYGKDGEWNRVEEVYAGKNGEWNRATSRFKGVDSKWWWWQPSLKPKDPS